MRFQAIDKTRIGRMAGWKRLSAVLPRAAGAAGALVVLAAVAPVIVPPLARADEAVAPAPIASIAPILSGMDRIHPVTAAHAMVASQEGLATRVGVRILRSGGNAVDAAVAVGFALAVTLPRAGNLGGGGFMLVHDAGTGRTVALDYRETAPAAAFSDMFLDETGKADPQKSRFSGLAVGVPGTVAGMLHAWRGYGSGTLSLADVMAPAIALARDGFPVSGDLARSLEARRERLSSNKDARGIFYKADGSSYRAGEILRQPALAKTLQRIAREEEKGFYEGPVADGIVATVGAAGGAMTHADLAAYRVREREPVTGGYRGYTVVSMPPPSSGGIHIIEILNILEGYPIAEMGFGAAETMHVMAEAMKRAYADRARYLGDPDFVEVPQTGLTAKPYADMLRAAIRPDRATPAAEIVEGDPTPYESNETTHFSVVDSTGNAVSNTYTLNFSYGVGLVAQGTGVLLNNELDDFSAKPGTPNAYGLVGGAANAVAPRKRPLSSMSPTMVFRDGVLVLVTGSPGGSRIITTVAQIILNVIDHGMNIAEATVAPRMHHQWLPDELRVEEGFSPDTLAFLRAKGHTVVEKATMGSTQSILITPTGLSGASDTRREGALTAGY